MATMKKTDTREPTPEQARARLQEILESHWSVLLFTHGRDGSFQGRPMGRERIDPDGTIYFYTGMESKKVAEIEDDSDVTIAIQGKVEYAVVRGTARVSQERALIDELWQDSWKVWFPDGKGDPSIAIVVVKPIEGTYWDQARTQGLSFLYRLAKARLTGREVEIDPGDSAHVTMGRQPPRG